MQAEPVAAESADHNRGLDVLRALAMTLVFFSHFPTSPIDHPALFQATQLGSGVGVDLFFVLSGFLIANQIFTSMKLKGHPELKVFYTKRFFKILPCYWTVLFCYFQFPWFRERGELPPLWRFLTFTQNFDLEVPDYGAFSHAWSLCIQEQFYLTFPFLCLLLRTWLTPRRFMLIFIASLGGTFMARDGAWQYVALTGPPPNVKLFLKTIYYPTYCRMDPIMVGLALALLRNFRRETWEGLARFGNWATLLGGLLVLVVDWVSTPRQNFFFALFGFPLVALGWAGVVFGALSQGSVLSRLRMPGARWFNGVTYSLYLMHKQTIHWVQEGLWYLDLPSNGLAAFAVSMLASLLVAWMLTELVERPFMNIRNKLVRQIRGESPDGQAPPSPTEGDHRATAPS